MVESLAPGFLIAAPNMRDPRFERSVVLLAEAGEDGALGFIINREMPYSLGEIEDQIGFPVGSIARTRMVHYGGPVSPERGWILFDHDALPDTEEPVIDVGDSMRVGATMDALKMLVQDDAPNRFRLVLGYAGWAPEQLSDEIKTGSWLTLEIDRALVFDTPIENLWDAAIKRLGLEPGFLWGGGSAEA